MKYLLGGQETRRLNFRLLEESDFNSWLKLFKAKNVAKFLGLDSTLSDKQLCQLWFDKVFDRYENDLGGMNVLVDKKTKQLIGQCGLLIQTVENRNRLEIGYSILPEFWNHGFASEASQKCRDYAFENNFADSLISIVHINNISSEKVALKNGMKLEKRLDNYKGNPVNIFGIKKELWVNSKFYDKNIFPSNYCFQSERLIIEPLRKSDASSLFQIYSDAEAMKYRGSKPLVNIDDAYKMISEQLSKVMYTSKIRLGIRRKSDNCLIGTLLLKIDNDFADNCEIGFSFGKKYWGNGFAQETLKAVESQLSNLKNIKKISAWCIKENIASARIFEKAAFHTIEQNKYPQSILYQKKIITTP